MSEVANKVLSLAIICLLLLAVFLGDLGLLAAMAVCGWAGVVLVAVYFLWSLATVLHDLFFS